MICSDMQFTRAGSDMRTLLQVNTMSPRSLFAVVLCLAASMCTVQAKSNSAHPSALCNPFLRCTVVVFFHFATASSCCACMAPSRAVHVHQLQGCAYSSHAVGALITG